MLIMHQTHRLAVKTTLSRVREGHLREALVVNTSGAPFTVKYGMRLSPRLAYGTQVVSELGEFSSICVSSIVGLREDHSNSHTPLEPFRQRSIFCRKENGTAKNPGVIHFRVWSTLWGLVMSHSVC